MLCMSVRVHTVAYIRKNTFTRAYAYVTFLSFCVVTPARCISPSCRGEWETVSGFTELISNREQWIVTILSLQFWLLLESPCAGGQDPPCPVLSPILDPGLDGIRPWLAFPATQYMLLTKGFGCFLLGGKISVCVLGRWNVLGDILGSSSGGKKLA